LLFKTSAFEKTLKKRSRFASTDSHFSPHLFYKHLLGTRKAEPLKISFIQTSKATGKQVPEQERLFQCSMVFGNMPDIAVCIHTLLHGAETKHGKLFAF
jgi:hypothetical protein